MSGRAAVHASNSFTFTRATVVPNSKIPEVDATHTHIPPSDAPPPAPPQTPPHPLLIYNSTFAQALVRIAMTCFGRNTLGVVSDKLHGSIGGEGGSPGNCLRALLTYMWRRLHASVGLALNGVRAGRTRHRSNMRKVTRESGRNCGQPAMHKQKLCRLRSLRRHSLLGGVQGSRVESYTVFL